MTDNFITVNSATHIQKLLSEDLTRVSLIYFWVPWAEQRERMDEVVLGLAKRYHMTLFLKVKAQELADITESFDIEAAPYFVILRGHTFLVRISGADEVALNQALETHARALDSPISIS
ncbi:hypothetical protein BD779DRAFT_1673661 [Infundibulicybe gibba]|nr:hypothetical protein BD779DRAFT_1673661 [Infundibulicybe gibba]